MPHRVHLSEPPAPVYSVKIKAARLALAAVLGEHAADLSGRDDLAVKVLDATVTGAPAEFSPDKALIRIEAGLFETTPRGLRRPAPRNPLRRPVGYGALVHEAAHAAHSKWGHAVPDSTGTAELAAAKLLEEVRIESAQLAQRPADFKWLRSAMIKIILDDAPAACDDSPWAAAQAAVLVLGRAEDGTFTDAEAAPVAEAAEKILGPELLGDLRAVWNYARTVGDSDADGMIDCGRAWCKLLGADPAAAEPAPQQGPQLEDVPEPAGLLARAMAQTAVRVGVAALGDQPATGPAEELGGEPEQQAEARRVAAKVFDPASGYTGPVTGTRAAFADEQRQAQILADRLKKAAVRERAVTVTASALPPGRLNPRAALARDAQRAAGAMPTATPWTRTERRATPIPPLRVGIAVDATGSMSPFTGPAASLAWTLARAASRSGLDATSATVAFTQNRVTAITRPGLAPAAVTGFRARGSGHVLGQAIDALDSGLGLARPGAARLLVVISDGRFTLEETHDAKVRISRLRASGCAVLQIARAMGKHVAIPGADLVTVTAPATAGALIGDAAVKALART